MEGVVKGRWKKVEGAGVYQHRFRTAPSLSLLRISRNTANETTAIATLVEHEPHRFAI